MLSNQSSRNFIADIDIGSEAASRQATAYSCTVTPFFAGLLPASKRPRPSLTPSSAICGSTAVMNGPKLASPKLVDF